MQFTTDHLFTRLRLHPEHVNYLEKSTMLNLHPDQQSPLLHVNKLHFTLRAG